MSGGGRRVARRACLTAAAVCGALFIALPALAQDGDAPVAGPAVWHGAATAGGISFEVDRDALLPIGDALRFTALDGLSVYETDRQTARASLLYPGEGVLQGPNLVCGTFGASFPPEAKPLLDLCATYDYPLSVFADASQHDKSTLASTHLGKATDPISADAITAKAHADVDSSTTDAVIEDLKVLGLPVFGLVQLLPIEQLQLDPTVASVGSATAKTDQRIDDEGHLVVRSTSVLSGVDLVGGLVHIGAISSMSQITDDGNGKRTADSSIELGGVSVAGLPASITDQGLVLGSPTGPIQQALSTAVNQLLRTLGVKIALLPAEHTTDDGTGQASASASGLLVEVALNVQGAPTVPGPLGDIDLSGTYVGSLQLGATAASGAASTFGPDGAPPTEDTSTPVDLGGGFGTDGGVDLGSPTPQVPGGGAPVAPTTPVERTSSTPTDLFGGRLELLYAAFAFAVLGLCIAPRLTVPARLPGASS